MLCLLFISIPNKVYRCCVYCGILNHFECRKSMFIVDNVIYTYMQNAMCVI